MNTPSTAWFRIYRPRPAAEYRLLCLPHAGGSASFFRAWPEHMPAHVEVVAVQYPGREDRIRDAFAPGMTPLADALAEAVTRHLRPPYILFGHSMGAAVAYEVAHRLEAAGPGVAHLFASGRHAPQDVHDSAVHLRDDDGLMAELARLGGTPEPLLAEPGLREIVLPVLRGDYRLAETYRAVPRPPLRCPVTAVIGDRDPEVTAVQALRWEATTGARFRLETLPGDHFQLVPNLPDVAAIVRREAVRTAADARPWPSTP